MEKIKQLNMYFNAKAQKKEEEIHIFYAFPQLFLTVWLISDFICQKKQFNAPYISEIPHLIPLLHLPQLQKHSYQVGE